MLENPAKSIYLGIGSNLGNRKINIEKAKFHLIQNKIKILKSSNFYESLSWPNPKKPKFLNIVLKIDTNLKPLELLKRCKEIEINLGRKKTFRNFPRVCDIDVIDFKNQIFRPGYPEDYITKCTGIDYVKLDYTNSPKNDMNTYPQIYVKNKNYYNLIGGYTEFNKWILPEVDYFKLKEITKQVTENLNNIIDYNYYPTEKTERSNFRHRPIGIGVQGLANLFFEF